MGSPMPVRMPASTSCSPTPFTSSPSTAAKTRTTGLKQHSEKFKLRKTLAEHPFGTIKRWFGYTHFLLKGLPKVQCEWSLTTLAYNLKRVLNLVRFGKLMAAVV
jgi:hypothetical protein